MADEQDIARAEVNGQVVQLEVRKSEDPEVDVSIKDVLSFDGVTDSIQAIAASIESLLSRVSPNHASVELGFDIGVESGALTALLVKGTGSATIKVTLDWQRGSTA